MGRFPHIPSSITSPFRGIEGPVAAGLFLLGALGLVIQSVFLREMFAVFRGGEFTVGIALLAWLLWTAAGSGLFGRFVARVGNPGVLFIALIPLYGLFGLLATASIGSASFLFRLLPGELVPYDLQFIGALLFSAPFNLLGGYLFALGVRASEGAAAPSAGRAFTLEALGAATGGLLFSGALVYALPNHFIALACPLAAALFSAVVLSRRKPRTGTALVLFAAILAGFVSIVQSRAAGYPFRGQILLQERDTPYGRLRVTRTAEQVTFSSDAALLFSAPDPESAEYAVHFPMLAAPDSKQVLILGGGPGGAVAEALKYPGIGHITVVELDPAVFTLADTHLGKAWRSDPRVETVHTDPRAFLSRTRDRFDVIVMTTPEPLSGLANRTCTRGFFRLAASRMTPDGVLGFSLEGAENYIPGTLAVFLASIRGELGGAFPSTAVIPGLRCGFLASNRRGALDGLSWERIENTRARLGIETAYVREYFLRFAMSPERTARLDAALGSVKNPPPNTDTHPAGYLARTAVQGELDSSRTVRLIAGLAGPRTLLPLMALLAAAFLIPAFVPGRERPGRAAASCVFALGFTGISFTVTGIMAYQSFFGCLYGNIAFLTGSFMAGLAAGGWLGMRMSGRGDVMRSMAYIQVCAALAALLWMLLLSFGGHPLTEPFFFLLAAVSGLLGGLQFPLADARYRASRPDARSAGAVYAFDLAGASLGALLTGTLLVPGIGMFATLGFLVGMNVIAARSLRR